jgi:hypothetical protein
MAKISADDALDLAKLFKQSALDVGQFQLDHWDDLSTSQRRALTDEEYTLLDHSQNLVTYGVGVILDDAQASLNQIKKATADANKAIETIQDIKKVLTIAAALVALGASIYVGNPAGVASAVTGVVDAIS